MNTLKQARLKSEHILTVHWHRAAIISACLLIPVFFPCALHAKDATTPALSKTGDTRIFQGVLRLYNNTDFNRTMGTNSAIAVTDRTLLWNMFSVGAGLSFLCTYPSLNGLYLDLGVDNFFVPNLDIHMKFLGNPYAEYGMAANSVILYASYAYAGFFVSLGANWRFLNTDPSSIYNLFDYRNTVRETLLYYRIGWGTSFIDERYRFNFELNNFEDFYAGNTGFIGFGFTQSYRIDRNWGVFLNLWARPAGQIGLATTPYRFIFEIGGEFYYE